MATKAQIYLKDAEDLLYWRLYLKHFVNWFAVNNMRMKISYTQESCT